MADVDAPPPTAAGGRWSRRFRSLAAGVLIVVFALSLVEAGLGLWVKRNTLNRDVWSERVVPLGTKPEVQQALAAYTTQQLMETVDPDALFAEALPERAQILAIPLSAAVREFVAEKVDEFFASEQFERLWVAAATKAHDAAISTLKGERPAVVADDEKIQINLIPLIDAVLAEIADEVPDLIGRDVRLPRVTVDDVPDVARARLAEALGVELDDDFGTVTIYDGGTLSAAQLAVRWIERLPILGAILATLAAAGALWVSPRRRRTAFQLIGAAALGAVAIRRMSSLLQDQVEGLVVDEINRAAAQVVVATFVDPLTAAAATLLWVLALLALVLAITGPYGWARSLRTTAGTGAVAARGAATELATAPTTAAWAAAHRDHLRIAGWVAAALVLWFASLSWLLLLALVAGVVAWQVAVDRIAAGAPAPTPTPATSTP